MKTFSVNIYRSGKLFESKKMTAYNVAELQKKIVAYIATLYSLFFSGGDFTYKIRVAWVSLFRLVLTAERSTITNQKIYDYENKRF